MAKYGRRNLTKKEAVAIFNEEVKPQILKRYGPKDKVAMRCGWNDFTDSLCKDGLISDYAYANWVQPKF